jgi:signal transduction histidine kinase
MTPANIYLKRFAAWVIALQERYATDLFFRTTVNIVLLQATLVVVTIVALWFALTYITAQIAIEVTKGVVNLLASYPLSDPQSVARSVQAVGVSSVWWIFGGIVLLAVGGGMVLAYITLRPARESLRYQKLFISNVAHELRTPLSTIKTSSEVTLLDEKLPLSVRRVMQQTIVELDRISEILNNLLSLNTLNRPERMQFQNIDLGPIVDMIVERLATLAQERGIRVLVKKDEYRLVWGNATALEQVTSNIVKNALAYTPKNSGGTVSISLKPDYHGAVVFAVSDTGIGISQEDLFHIFEPFYRADTSRVRNIKKSGSGLGLTIVNELVRVHHGKIHIQSARRKGTTVSVFLPSGSPGAGEAGAPGQKRQGQISMDFSRGYGEVRRAIAGSEVLRGTRFPPPR